MEEEGKSGFIGDCKYLNDGGNNLQKLWELWKWTEIKNCPGRYVLKRNIESLELSPVMVLDILKISCQIYEYNIEGKDLILIGYFPDGGGILTYVKEQEGNIRYIHTLNTQSGLLRKVKSLNINLPSNITEEKDDLGRFLT